MQSFQLYIEDDRYSVPTLALVEASTERRVRARATEFLLQSAHHLSVEVRAGDRHLFTVGSERRPSPASGESARA